MARARGKSGPPCHECKHRERVAIELALVRGVAVSAIAKRYGVGAASLFRHRRRATCMPPQLKAKLLAGPDVAGLDLERVRTAESESLLLHLVNQRNRIFAAFDSAEEVGHLHGIVRVSAELRAIQELIGKIVGQLGTGTTVNNNVLFVSPAYIEMRMALIRALAPYPDARVAVAAALGSMEEAAAKDITSETRTLQFAVDPRKAGRATDAVAEEAQP
jgi:transposase-like protein